MALVSIFIGKVLRIPGFATWKACLVAGITAIHDFVVWLAFCGELELFKGCVRRVFGGVEYS